MLGLFGSPITMRISVKNKYRSHSVSKASDTQILKVFYYCSETIILKVSEALSVSYRQSFMSQCKSYRKAFILRVFHL